MNRRESSPNLQPSTVPLRRPILAMVTDSRLYRTAEGAESDSDIAGSVAAAAGRAARAGVDLVQIRERSFEPVMLLDLITRVRQATEATGARVVVNDRVDVALAAAADGVHLPAAAPPCHRVRTLVREGFLIGRSVHSVSAAVAAEEAGGCDYLIFGTVYESASKPAGHPIAGIDGLARVCGSVRLPVLAIGGITLERVPAVAAAGAAGIAAIGLFASGTQADLAQTVARIRQAFDHS